MTTRSLFWLVVGLIGAVLIVTLIEGLIHLLQRVLD